MADRTAALMRGLDAPREIPSAVRARLESALVANTLEPTADNLPWILERPKRLPDDMRLRLVATLTGAEDDESFAAHFEGLDDPRALPIEMRARLIDRLRRRPASAARAWQIFGAAAAAVLVLVATLVVTNGTSDNRPSDGVALPPAVRTTQPAPAVSITPSSPPTTDVLGNKETRSPSASKPSKGTSKPRLGVSPIAQPSGIVAFPATAPSGGSANRSAAPGRSFGPSENGPGTLSGSGLVGSVVQLVQSVLRSLSVDVLSAGNPSSSVATPQAPPAPAAPKSAATKRRASAPKAPRPAAPAATKASPATEPQPLISLPLFRQSSGTGQAVILDVPVLDLSLSL